MRNLFYALLAVMSLGVSVANAAETVHCADSTGNLKYVGWYDDSEVAVVKGRETWTLKTRLMYNATYYDDGTPADIQGVLRFEFVEGTIQYVGDNQITQVVKFWMHDASSLPSGIKPKMVMMCRRDKP
jgi:hypothetical protein